MELLPLAASPGCCGTLSAIGWAWAACPSYDDVTSSPPPGGIGSRPSGSTTTTPTATATAATTPPSAQRFGRIRLLVAGTSSATNSTAKIQGPTASHPASSSTSATTRPT